MFYLIDNYDSFTYNVAQYFYMLGAELRIGRNDQISIAEIAAEQPNGLIISPGPGRPEMAGICLEAIQYFADKIPILGICLGHQAIGQAFGGKVIKGTDKCLR